MQFVLVLECFDEIQIEFMARTESIFHKFISNYVTIHIILENGYRW